MRLRKVKTGLKRKHRQEHIEPMEVVQRYMNGYHKNMDQLNTLPPSIEPRAPDI